MANILCLETSTANCSVAVGVSGTCNFLEEGISPQYSQSENLHPFIEKALKESGLRFRDVDAVAVSKGPGSYTGLRIGVSAAKGLCFALDIPLIALSSLEILKEAAPIEDGILVPLIDARRMEVYSAIYHGKHEEIQEVKAEIIRPNSFLEFLDRGIVYLFGNGAAKCSGVVSSKLQILDLPLLPSSKEMCRLAEEKYRNAAFEDLAYFEPYYVKDFMVAPSKSPL